jgi:N-acetylmuramoyl-L-alanine amidase
MIRTIAILLLLLSFSVHAQQVEVRAARLWTAPDQTRLVVDLAASVEHKVFRLEGPERLVIDIPDAGFKGKVPTVDAGDPLVKGMRSGVREGDDLRLVLDLKQPVRAKSFLLAPNERYGYRLVVDLLPSARPGVDTAEPHRAVAKAPEKLRDVVIAIDAGHGGEDPGASGASGTEEKHVTLAIARTLAALVEKEPGMRPVLIRDGDYYVGLRQRIRLARRHNADLFVSIHADAYEDKGVEGSSVFTLAQKGATSKAAAWLADKENSADRIGGIELKDKDDDLTKTIWDMVQNATMEHSQLVAKRVLTELGHVCDMHNGKVQRAGFVVLKAPDIPSMLVETGFITNPQEEKRLTSKRHQRRIAEAILSGIKRYYEGYPPLGTRLAVRDEPRRHVINQGDTLLEIAKRYAVSLSSLRRANGLDTDTIRVGEVLTIPES